jgi:bacterioferritin-associated ferredoxin
MDKSTIICRCEEITVADVENAVQQGARTFRDVKRMTRSGMGMCQGKVCQNIIVKMISELTGEPISAEMNQSNARIPLQPLSTETLAQIKK